MQTFISDIFPRLQRYSEKLDNLTLLTNQHWVIIDNIDQTKAIYIFRSNGDLLISVNGIVDKGSWAYLGNNSLLVEKTDGKYLFKHGFFDENVLALKVDNSNEYVVMVNENKSTHGLNSLKQIESFLQRKYLGSTAQGQLEVGKVIHRSRIGKSITLMSDRRTNAEKERSTREEAFDRKLGRIIVPVWFAMAIILISWAIYRFLIGSN